MKNLVGYHNADKMGYSFHDAREPMMFLTTKSVEHLVGARIWSVAGEGKPRGYSLGGWFIVDDIGPSKEDPFVHYIRGTVGQIFKPMLRLNERPWFSRFRQSQGNFSLGLNVINEEFVLHLEALATAAV